MNIFIDIEDMEERYGKQLYQDYLVEQNKDLKQRIDKAIKYIKKDSLHYAYEDDYDIYLCESELEELLEILKGSDNNVSKK